MKPKPGNYPEYYLYHRIVKAKLFMDAHFGEAIDLNNIADEACFSKYHFIRLFKTIYGKTPHRYLTHVRMEQARKYLEQGLTITETCGRVGFDSLSSFAGLFKKLSGQTATEYQRRYRVRQEKIKDQPFHFVPHCFAHQNGWLKKSNFREA